MCKMTCFQFLNHVVFLSCILTAIIFHKSKAAPSIIATKNQGKFMKLPYSSLRILYTTGGESELPSCEKYSVCSRVDTYSRPWVERLCSCGQGRACSANLRADDGYTIVDRSRQYKLCNPVESLPRCRFFKDITWTYITRPDNKSQQVVNCLCPENGTPYISGHQSEYVRGLGQVYKYFFSCSPQSALSCRKKEPCRLFTVHKRYPVEEITTSTLCNCPSKSSCPVRHTDDFVVKESMAKLYLQEGVRTYSAYCAPAVR